LLDFPVGSTAAFKDFASIRSSVNCGTFEPSDATDVCFVALVPLVVGFGDSTADGFDVADGFFGILSNAGFLVLFDSLDNVCLVGGVRHVDFFSSVWRSSISFVNTLLSCWLRDFFFSVVGVVGGVRFVVESIDIERLVVEVICNDERVSFDANGET